MATSMHSTITASRTKASENFVAWPTSAALTTLADVKVRNMLIRVSTSLWAVLRDASRPQCSVASNCARTDGGTASCWPSGLPPSVDMA